MTNGPENWVEIRDALQEHRKMRTCHKTGGNHNEHELQDVIKHAKFYPSHGSVHPTLKKWL